MLQLNHFNANASFESLWKMNPKDFLYFYKNRKEEFLAKNSQEKWLTVHRVNVVLLKFIGVQFMESDYKLHLQTLIPAYLLINFFTLLFYTMYYYRHEPFSALQATPVCGIIIPIDLIFFSFFFFCN